MEELRSKLITEIEEADWNMLKPHSEKQSVFFVSADLDLVDVAIAIAMDKSHMVKVWLDAEQLKKPTEDEIKKYDQNEFKKMCKFLIIQPYVLAQKI